MLRQGTRKGIRRTPANRGMRAHWVVKGLDIKMCIRDSGSGIHHYEYSINVGAWTGCPVGDPTVTITAGGVTTVTARVVDGAGNASGQTATAKVFIDPAPPNVPGITLSTEQWTNTSVTATVKDNGDAHSGVARTEYSRCV